MTGNRSTFAGGSGRRWPVSALPDAGWWGPVKTPAYAAWVRFRTGASHHPWVCRDCGSVFRVHTCHLEGKAS